ncbi:PGPGW domain-containing protein [Mumia sp. zg.B53]|uniref:PGPGW domain-containing protein n=1 Tax=unclassified Mumia TaxID=2621872 RepID=UPI001C6F3794|nr:MULTISPECIES: PGPGW domain-containing protein [unclassified Mumia]MBW9206975.1 PGPGW domain-containing protein [Mumia sp. zg.B17]MBW9210693.1 PGPGW domain-containing protein [Mumia sp. zg.B21]MBW9215306.1 PGPGW domain-containing protein [Mumia sp. zg.B53]MDD9350088.1 PGPGW domain-containing protein [Mumia sp.]
MSTVRGFGSWLRATGTELLGWLLVVAGIAALVLPGPGLLMVFGGLAVLSNRYEWARRRVEPVKAKAFEAARYGVATWPRIALSVLGALSVMAFGVIWWMAPAVPTVGPLGPELPFSGWGTGLSLMISSVIALGLLGFSVARFRYGGDDDERVDGDLVEAELLEAEVGDREDGRRDAEDR